MRWEAAALWSPWGLHLVQEGVLGSTEITAAVSVDRLTFGSNIIETGTESYRLSYTQQQT